MKPGEIAVVRLSGGASIRRCLELDGPQVRVSVGRNRQAKVPLGRVMLWTGVTASSEEEVEEFRRQCEALAGDIALSELWEMVRDEAKPLSLDELCDLHWSPTVDATQRVALLLHLDEGTSYFAEDDGGYLARSQDAVKEDLVRRERRAEEARAAESLMEGLSQGTLPSAMDQRQRELLAHLRGFAVHGDSYTRAAVAHSLLERVSEGSQDLQRRSFDLLVGAGVMEAGEPLELERAGIPDEFPQDVLGEAEVLDPARAMEAPHRRDLTQLPAVTIDNAWTEDRDDAISLEVRGHDYRVGIHIADAGELISPDTALDREADRRMATLYLPERSIPMLPPRVSRELGSLAPGERRLALSVLVDATEAGEIRDWEVVPSVVCSRAALSYEDADQEVDDDSRPWHSMLAAMDRLAGSLRRKREEAGALVLERPEMLVRVRDSEPTDVMVMMRSTPARRLVTEMMVLCNSLLAEYARAQQLPAAYRSQPAPDLEGLSGISPAGEESQYDRVLQYQIMRRLPPAGLSTVPEPHGGLGVPAYIQATSPLRRYPDLVMQRQISHYLSEGRPLYPAEVLASVAARAEVQLRELSRIEDERRRYWFLKYLERSRLAGPDSSPETAAFQAVVLDCQPGRPALLELNEYPFRVRAELAGSETPGDIVTLRLHSVDLWSRAARFVQAPSA